MKQIRVSIEMNGRQVPVGRILGEETGDCTFRYDPDYLEREDAVPISLRLPLTEGPYSPEETEIFFDGLLPEGFTRRAVASKMHESASDYLNILAGLGRECIGAIRISPPEEEAAGPSYEKLTPMQVKDLAREGATLSAELVTKAHVSLTGATGKVGLYLDPATGDWYLPKGMAPSTYIVKQSHVRLKAIVANEQLTQLTASLLGIDIPESFIINLGEGRDEDVLLATRRFDRYMDEKSPVTEERGLKIPYRLHQEDFSQALGILASRKYEKEDRGEDGYLAKMFALVRDRFRNPLQDQLKLWDRVIFCFLTGNTDSHLKNFSALYDKDLKSVSLAPAYDLVSTVTYESSTREMSFFIGDDLLLDQISRKSFERAAQYCRISPAMAMKRFDSMADSFEKSLEEASEVLKEEGIPGIDEIREKILSGGGYRKIASE